MKILMLLAIQCFALTSANASELSDNALRALLTSQEVTLTGDVHAHETIISIYTMALKNKARIENNCKVVNNNSAKCFLMMTTYPIGETSIDYEVYLPGNELKKFQVYVTRGD